MLKKRKMGIAIVAAAFVTLLGGCKFHGDDFFSPEDRIALIINKIDKELNLDDAQKKGFEQIAWEIRDKISNMKNERKTKHEQIMALIRKEQITEDDVDELMTQHRQKMEEIADFAGQQIIRIHTLLTPEQREKLATIVETRMKNHCS